MSTPTTDAVRKSIEVLVPVERAWAVFTEEMSTWWPLATHSIGADQGSLPDAVVVEGRAGGSIYETVGDDRPLGRRDRRFPLAGRSRRRRHRAGGRRGRRRRRGDSVDCHLYPHGERDAGRSRPRRLRGSWRSCC